MAWPASPGGPPISTPEPQPAPTRGGRCHPAIVLGYAAAGLAIVLLSGLTAHVAQVPVSAQLGLFQMLPASYWAGLVLIALAAVLSVWTRSDALIAITGVVLLATLAGTPTLFEPFPRYLDAYGHFAEAQNLGALGHMPSDLASYSANWPGAFLVLLTLFGSGGATPIEFLSWYPFVAGGVTFLAIFELLRATFVPTIARQASFPTALFAVWAQYHVSPQSLGFVLLLLVLSTVRRRETRWRFVAATLFVGLVASHPTSAIILLSILGVYAVVTLIPRFHDPGPKEDFRRDRKFSQRVAITFAVVWLAWLFFLALGSSQAAQIAVVTRMNALLGLPEQTLNMATQRTQSDLLYVAPRIRTASIGIYGVFGLLSLAYLFRDRPSRDRFRLAFSALIGPGLVAFADIFAFSGQFYDRSILILATFVPALCFAGLARMRIPRGAKAMIIAALVGASVATGATAYYLEAFNLVPGQAVAATNFVYSLPDGSLVLDGKYPTPIWFDPGSPSVIVRFPYTNLWPTRLRDWHPGVPVYAVLDPTTELWYRQWYGSQLYSAYSSDAQNYSEIYDNGWTQIYYVPAG